MIESIIITSVMFGTMIGGFAIYNWIDEAIKSKKKQPMKTEGTGIFTILFIVFLVLKLTDNIDWSWWAVTAPLWIPLGIILIVVAVVGLGLAIAKIVNEMTKE